MPIDSEVFIAADLFWYPVKVEAPQMIGWVSPRLGIRFAWQPGTALELYGPDGRRFLSSVELAQRAEQAQQRAEQAQRQAEQAQQRAELAEQTVREAVPRLLALGLSAEQIANSLGLAIATVQAILDEGGK